MTAGHAGRFAALADLFRRVPAYGLVAGANPDRYVFADNVYLSPSAHRQLGTYAYDRLRARW